MSVVSPPATARGTMSTSLPVRRFPDRSRFARRTGVTATPTRSRSAGGPTSIAAAVFALVLGCLLALAAGRLAVAGEVVVAGGVDRVDVSDRIEWCETAPAVTAAEVLAGACRFAPITAADLEVGYSDRAHWLRFTLIGADPDPGERWLVIGHRRLQRVTFITTSSRGEVREATTGLSVPLAERPVDAAEPILPLRLAPGERLDVLVRVLSQTSINLSAVLWEPRVRRLAQARLEFWEAAAVGGLLAAAAFSLTIAAAGRVSQWSRMSNLWFGLLLVTKAIFNVANASLVSLRILPDDWSYDVRTQAIAMGASTVLLLLFLRRFLDSRRTDPRWDLVLRLAIVLSVAETVLAVFVAYGRAVQLLAPSAAAVILLAVVLFARALRAGLPAAGYLLTAFSLNLVQLLHRIVLGFAGAAFDDRLLLFYSWSYLLTVPLIPIGIALHEEALRMATEKARAEAAARVEFLARVSHELRTPLDTIMGNAQLLSRPTGAKLLREGLATIHDGARHLLRMIDDLLDHARGVAGRLVVAPHAVDWPAFLAAVERSGRLAAERGANRFVLRVTGAAPFSLAFDAGRLRQVLDNLVSNAVRHTRDGRISVTCHVGAPGAEGRVVLAFTVEDTGEGIAPADRERIFLPFERGSGTEARHGGKGIGMGLTIARQLVEAMGGRLTLESRSGEGATFCFTIVAAATAPLPSIAPATGATLRIEGGGRKILVVDDAEESRRILASLLRDCGFEVAEAASGDAACAAAELRPVDLVITDCYMAGGDGWQVLRRLAEIRPGVPVVLASAAPPTRPADLPRALDFAAAFLKPLDHDRLLRTVAELLGLSVVVEEPRSPEPVDGLTFDAVPPPAERERLRALVADGRFGEVMHRAEAIARSDPPSAAWAEALRTAALRLDLSTLADLLGDAPVPPAP